MKPWLKKVLSAISVSPDRCNQVLGMNRRNLDYIYPHNKRQDFPLADNKLKTKALMENAGVPVPQTYLVYQHLFEMIRLEQDIAPCTDFVIKPAQGSGGSGIVVIKEGRSPEWTSISGKPYNLTHIRKQISDIIFGVYSFDQADCAIIEERIQQHPEMEYLSPLGLADIRVILLQSEPVLAMSRVATSSSDGKSNLHQGAIGIGIDMQTGHTFNAIQQGKPIQHHPDTGISLLGHTLPYWEEVVDISRRAAQAVPLEYLGVDICIGERGPLLVEINVRPGLEIQNANITGMRSLLEALADTGRQHQ
jgi:alpha-L-glutamate ligase-like protein